jgi:hypothetical protein
MKTTPKTKNPYQGATPLNSLPKNRDMKCKPVLPMPDGNIFRNTLNIGSEAYRQNEFKEVKR